MGDAGLRAGARDESGWNCDRRKFAGAIRTSAPDVTPPTAVLLSAANINTATGSSYQFTVAFSDNEQIGAYNLYNATSPLTVTGPNGFSQTCQFISAQDGADGLSATGVYAITPPNGTWNFTNNGLSTVSLNDHAVSDFSGNYAAAGALGTFKVAVPVPDLGGSGLSDAAYMGIMSPGSNQSVQDYVSKGDRHDFYRVRVKSDMSIDTKLYGMTDNVDLQLLDGNGKVIANSAKVGTTSDAITQNVSPGTYYLHISYGGSSSTSYSLRISAGTPIVTTKSPKASVFSNVALRPSTNLVSGKAA